MMPTNLGTLLVTLPLYPGFEPRTAASWPSGWTLLQVGKADYFRIYLHKRWLRLGQGKNESVHQYENRRQGW